MDFDESLYGWSTHGPLQVLLLVRSAKGLVQGGEKIGHGGPLQESSSSDRKNTETNRMHSNDLEACGKKCYFWFHSEVKVLTRFWRLFDSVILPYFNAISMDFYTVKC